MSEALIKRDYEVRFEHGQARVTVTLVGKTEYAVGGDIFLTGTEGRFASGFPSRLMTWSFDGREIGIFIAPAFVATLDEELKTAIGSFVTHFVRTLDKVANILLEPRSEPLH